MYESGTVVMMVVLISCVILGCFLPAKKVKRLDLPFEIVVRARTPVVKEVIRYVDRPRKSIPIKTVKTTPVIPPPKTPVPVYTPPIIKNRGGTPTIKAVKPQVNQEAFNEAKRGLMSIGYNSGEAKRVLESVGHCDTAEEYIRKAMLRPKK
jgi:hypothetical protein